ncbi:MAG TPA: glycosyltransferase family 39 protein, partial [Vicinamibacterales bacterium]|nr:glycosyltransferase family 39 protein [Vicinamibacterales bacterium]
MPSPQWRTLISATLLICILLYAALLRLDALFTSFGPYEQPRWLAAMQAPVTSAAAAITPDWQWQKYADPYSGGDPITYLKFAREMRNFYAAHVREPMFPAMTRIGLLLSGNADVGVSITSIAFALLALVATYALGALVASRAVGLAAAAMLAIDQSAVYWAIGGWRDELFAFFAVSCAWAWTRFSRSPTRANAILAGALSGGACLTRITTFALIAPAVVWVLATSNFPLRTDGEYSARRRGADVRAKVALAVGVMVILVAPFLINCAVATGDPFYAINNHTAFYLAREGVVDVQPISAVNYSLDKFESRPIAAIDNAVRGVFVYPFSNKWEGLDVWLPGLGTVLAGLALAGLVGWLWSADGRLLLVMFFGSLVPFSMTWTVLGGAEWRLTLFAYSFYLVAAFWAVDKTARFVRATIIARDTAPWEYVTRREILRAAAIVLAIVVVTAAWLIAVPYAVAREALTYGDTATIMAGPRDRWFFVDGWSGLLVEGNVTLRSAEKPAATLRIFLPESRHYGLMLRANPVDPSMAGRQILQISLNGTLVDQVVLEWDLERIGQYRTVLPARIVSAGVQHLSLRSEKP